MFCHSIEMFNFEKTKKMVFQKKKVFQRKKKRPKNKFQKAEVRILQHQVYINKST